MDIEIRFENGWMGVHLDRFLEGASISQVKKLVKIIRNSSTPECEDAIREFIGQEMEQFELRQEECERYIIGYTEKVIFCQRQIDNSTTNRDKYKRNTDGWKHYNAFVKDFKQEMKELKTKLQLWKRERDRNFRNNDFYKKVLQIIN